MVVSHWQMQIPRFARDDNPNGCCQRKTTNGERLPSRTTNDELLMTQIKFGTDGWRGLIADDFTFDNVRRVAGAIASYVLKHEDPTRGVVIGHDTRFLSDRAARAVAEVIAA